MKKRYAGYIFCKKLNRKVYISLEAHCDKYGFICDCGVFINEFTFGHDLVWNGRLK